jgi:uroporphyrinogen-III decarboxylase
MHRERFMATLEGQPADRVPLNPLLMFLAADRAGIAYREYATNGQALAEAQLLVQERYDLDAVTACSDAFRITADLGAEMAYPPDKPPYATEPLIRPGANLKGLVRPDPGTRGW